MSRAILDEADPASKAAGLVALCVRSKGFCGGGVGRETMFRGLVIISDRV